MTRTQADTVYDLLVKEAGAPEKDRVYFLAYLVDQEHPMGAEFRFQGRFGFGGKFYAESDRWRISCYNEDRTPERVAIIDKVNAELRQLREVAIG